MTSGEQTGNSTYLTFTLDQEDFAVDVTGVREVLDYTNVTRVPRTPEFMKGVINLRGSVVPVVDMRLKFGLAEAEKTVDTCVIVLEVEMDGEVTVIGAIADSVKEVFELSAGEIEPPPRLGTRFETEFISGIGKHNDNFIIILDVNEVFSGSELALFRDTEKSVPEPDTAATQEPDPATREHDEPVVEGSGGPTGEGQVSEDAAGGEEVISRDTRSGKKPRKSPAGASPKGGKGGKKTGTSGKGKS